MSGQSSTLTISTIIDSGGSRGGTGDKCTPSPTKNQKHICDWICENRPKGTFCISRNTNLKY